MSQAQPDFIGLLFWPNGDLKFMSGDFAVFSGGGRGSERLGLTLRRGVFHCREWDHDGVEHRHEFDNADAFRSYLARCRRTYPDLFVGFNDDVERILVEAEAKEAEWFGSATESSKAGGNDARANPLRSDKPASR